MSRQLPEVNFDKTALNQLTTELSDRLHGFNLKKISYLDTSTHQRSSVSNIEELFTELLKLHPVKRNHVQLAFDFTRKPNISKKTSATIFLGANQESSRIEISGATARIQSEESEKIASISSKYERHISNAVGKSIFAYFFPLGLIFLNYFFPKTIYPNSLAATVVTAVFSATLFLFFHHRPHSFFMSDVRDYLHVIPNYWKLILVVLMSGATGWGVTQIPILIHRDQEIVAETPHLQLRVLRQIVTPELLQKIEILRNTSQLYDKASGNEQKSVATRSLTLSISDVLAEGRFSERPIGKLDVFVSSASKLSNGNWLHEPLLLMATASSENGHGAFLYKPHIYDNSFGHNHFLGVNDWLSEPVLKDKFGKVWTRDTFIAALDQEIRGKIDSNSRDALARLRQFPEEKLEFKVGTQQAISPQNSVENETVRAIAEELLRSMNKMQQDLSANPEGK